MSNTDSRKERVEALKSLSFSPITSAVFAASTSDIHFVGLGNAGCNALKYIFQKKIKAKYTAITELRKSDFPEGINLIPFTPPRKIIHKMKDKSIWASDMDKQLVIPDGIRELFNKDHLYILLSGLGGFTGTYFTETISSMLSANGKMFFAICSLPFPFEGSDRNTIAINAFNNLRLIDNFRYFDFKVLSEQFNKSTLDEVFEKGNEQIHEIFSKIFENVESDT
jgi:cell division GTPase FtsZ